MMGDMPIRKSAVLSPCGQYRYRLARRWDDGIKPCVLFVMLNPSTADADIDDPTIRRCIGFCKAWGYGALSVVNLFAYRATKPDVLLSASDPVGPENDEHIKDALAYSDFAVCAWGANKVAVNRAQDVLRIIRNRNKIPHCLGQTKSGAPKHPLYIVGDTLPSLLGGE